MTKRANTVKNYYRTEHILPLLIVFKMLRKFIMITLLGAL